MNGPPTDFWGKLELDPETGAVAGWHPLLDHCADVAACAAELLRLPTWRHRLARFAGRDQLDSITCSRLSVLAALHDLGKFNIGFQARGHSDLGPGAGHVPQALGAVQQSVMSAVWPLDQWGEGATGLLVAALCHHGRPYAFQHAVYEPALWTPRGGLDPQQGVNKLVAATREWFPDAFTDEGPDLPVDPGFEHAYAGLVMLADWLGSDPRIFSFTRPGAGDRIDFARDAATTFISRNWLHINDVQRSDRSHLNAFSRIAKPGHQPRPAQHAMLQLPSGPRGSITILEAETGSGKTEAAVARFVEMFSAGHVDGMYFALPTRTAATQMYQRVLEAMQRAFGEPPPVVQAVPGYLRVDGIRGTALPHFEVLWPDTDRERFRHRAWAGEGPKRFLAGCVVVGTIDQVLLSSLRVGHAHLRATALLRQLLIVDEVHASDAYMIRILDDVLARHLRAGGHAVLLSATLGGETRAKLLHPGERPVLPDLEAAVAKPYPLISYRGETDLAVAVESSGQERTIGVVAESWLECPDAVAGAALDAARMGAKVLVIKNTVADCLDTQRCLERIAAAASASHVLFTCEGVMAPHHARFSRADREALDRALEMRFGEVRAPGGCVLVATQTVQQSLDIDADLLVTDLCPMDVLLQRIGRLHRHRSHKRPHGFERACAMVIVPADRNLGALLGETGRPRHYFGLGSVYPDLRILEATWRLVEQTREWRIPAMNRALVEQSIHTSALESISMQERGRWTAHSQRTIGTERGATRQADLNLVDWTIPYSDTTFADDVRVPTRLGERDRRVRFEHPFMSPFGCRVHELTIPERWARDIPATEVFADNAISSAGIATFGFGGVAFLYDRTGLRRVSENHEATPENGDN